MKAKALPLSAKSTSSSLFTGRQMMSVRHAGHETAACRTGHPGQTSREESPRFFGRKVVKRAIFVAYLIFWLGVAYAITIGYRSMRLHTHARTNTIMSSGIFRADDRLGFAAHPGVTGTLFFASAPHIPMRFDQNGCRVPLDYDPDAERSGGTLLTLGCSFTDGFACSAEDTYPFLLGDQLDAKTLNAGFGAYGLAQMLIQARELIPKFKPDYVSVQYSPWLIDRALHEYAPNDIGKRPQPFFWRDDEGRLQLHGPVFRTSAFRFPVADYRKDAQGQNSFASFLWRLGFPFFLANDIQVLGFRLRQAVGLVPRPDDNRMDVLRYAYGDMLDICRENGSQMVVCSLAHPWDPPRSGEQEALQAMPGVIFVDGWAALTNTLADGDPETYQRAYAHYRGDPPVLVDGHPNPAAHALIADAIARQIAAAAHKEVRNK